MKQDNEKKIISDVWLDEMQEMFAQWLRDWFPWMDEWVIKKHLDFIELLNEYTWSTLHGIHSFLDEKWYDLVWINFYNHKTKPLSKDDMEGVRIWKILMWFKVFAENYWTEKQKNLMYRVLAKKQNTYNFGDIKTKISELLSWNKKTAEVR